MSTTTQAILTAVFPAGIPPERYEDLSAIQQKAQELADLAGGWTKEAIEQCAFKDSHPEPTANIRHPEFRPKHVTKPTRESLKLTEKIVSLRAKGLHWHQIAAKVGLSKEAARKRYREWEKKQPKENDIELFEPGAEEAAAEAALAGEVLKSAPEKENSPSSDEQINSFIAAMDSQNALDIEILQAVRRQFPGVSMTVAGIRARRR